ncbi:MAG TPA: 4Fe-4S binding protein [Longilinea sp.]|nr:4Fe-4S binding protein [Longilinea sp.]
MKIGSMFSNVFGSLFKKPVTQLYPFVAQTPPPARFRGMVLSDMSKCTGCMMCVKDCPAEALEVFTIDKAARRFVMLYHVDRCTFCEQCVISCHFNVLSMSNQKWELASTQKEAFAVYYGQDADIASLVERAAHPLVGEPEKS